MLSRPSNPAAKVSLIAVFTAVSLGTNYAMIGVPNVKLMDTFVFISAFLFGLDVGLGTAMSVWAVYGFWNPYGVDDLVTLSFLTTGECFYAFAGWALGRATVKQNSFRPQGSGVARRSIVFGLVGLLATFAYDVITNFGTYLTRTSSAYQAFIVGMITGAPFALLHEGSNLIFFATAVPLAIASSRRSGLLADDVGKQAPALNPPTPSTSLVTSPSIATSLRCPSCAASITPKFGETIITCEYCGSTVTLGNIGLFNLQER